MLVELFMPFCEAPVKGPVKNKFTVSDELFFC